MSAIDTVVAEGDELLVRDLHDDHIGWMIQVWNRPDDATAPSTTFVLMAIRRWIYQGGERAGLLDDDTRGGMFIGTEHSATGNMRVRVLRQIRKPRRPRRAATHRRH